MSGKNWAITIGINRYTNLPALKFADRDALAVGAFLQEELAATVIRFADDRPPPPPEEGNFSTLPTFGELRNFLRRRFERPFLRPGDNLWFFFAGHGLQWSGRDYLLASDSDPGDPEATAFHVGWVVDRLRRSGADNVLLFLDACRNAEGGRDGGPGIGREAQKGVVTIFGCSPQQKSYELDELEQGAFTHALLEGLRLQGAGNCATVDRLYKYLLDRVPSLTAAKSGRQVPYACIEPASKLHLILLPRRATMLDTEPLRRQALRAERDGRYAEARALWIRVLAVSPADAEAIEEIEHLARRGTTAAPNPPPDDGSDRGPVVSSSEVPAPVVSPPTPQDLPLQVFEVAVVRLDDRGQEISVETVQRQQVVMMLPGDVPLEMVPIPAGKFLMGSPENEAQRGSDEGPQHEVSVPEFWLGRYPVTQSQWRAIAGLDKVKLDLDLDPSGFKGPRRPVECVSWLETLEFCARLSAYAQKSNLALEFRLPTEAEWEYACRAGTTTPFHFGPTLTDQVANYDANYTYGNGPKGKYRQETTEVGSFQKNGQEIANRFGLVDMHGNVWEWCLDWWFANYDGAPKDGSARRNNNNHSRSAWAQILADWQAGKFDNDASYRLFRAGSWGNLPRYCRSAQRRRYARSYRNNRVGFRLACSKT